MFRVLREHTAGTPNAKARAAAAAAHALWSEIDPDLAELDEFGGGDYATQDDVTDRLHELKQVLRTHPIDRDDRRALLETSCRTSRAATLEWTTPFTTWRMRRVATRRICAI